ELGKVVSFEPNPEAYRILKKNIELNGYKNCIAENVALSDEKSSLKLFIGRSTDGSSSLFLVDEVNKKDGLRLKL
ncbi:MAG: FkbM family methyltransferase, partial [Leptospiraceae bacterium]|nr:FkbM family methyltransferase [Leptospiraceae bacterium]